MTHYKSVIARIALCMAFVLCIVGCTTEVDYTMGSEFVPTNQHMELKRRVYRAGVMTEGDKSIPCQLSSTRLYRTDSIASSNIRTGYFGCEYSDIYGERTAGFMTQMIFSLSLHKDRGWGYRPIFDSMQLSLYITDYHGDTTRKHRFGVYEITSNDYLSLSQDTSFHINFDPTPYISKEPIFEFDFPNQEKGIYVGDINSPKNYEVLLEETPASREYISRLMFTTDLDATGGYALDKDSLYVEGNELAFIDVVRGVYIAPVESTREGDEEGIMLATSLENTALLLYARDRYEEDPTIIKDTTYMVYNFYLDSDAYDISAGNVSINSIRHDYAGSKLAAIDGGAGEVVSAEVSTCYVEGMGGVVTEVTFTDEFIQSLADIVLSAEEAVVSVNQAQLGIYLEGSNYDYSLIDPAYITPILNASMSRMGLYTHYGSLIAISDYAYSVETNYTLAYDGYINRSLACYNMDISTYIQSLMYVAADNVDDQGKVLFERFEEGYSEGTSYVGLRRFYIAPEAYSLYTFQRQSIYGADGGVEGEQSVAPIKLDMTYTLVY